MPSERRQVGPLDHSSKVGSDAFLDRACADRAEAVRRRHLPQHAVVTDLESVCRDREHTTVLVNGLLPSTTEADIRNLFQDASAALLERRPVLMDLAVRGDPRSRASATWTERDSWHRRVHEPSAFLKLRSLDVVAQARYFCRRACCRHRPRTRSE